ASLSFLSLRPRPPRSPLFPYTTLFRSYPGWPISVCDSVDLPDPFGPITAWTSPLSIASETPFRICRPSTLARRSLISKSANSLLALLDHVSAVVCGLGHPRGARDVGAEKPLVHLLLV